MATRGWKQWTEAEARAAVAEWRASGLTVRAFCAPRGYSRSRLQVWRDRFDAATRLGETVRARRRQNRAVAANAVATLIPVRLVERDACGETPIEVAVRSGQIVRVRRGFDPEALAAVVRALEGAC